MYTFFITGCATGFGFELAQRAIALGHRVVATDQRPGDLEDRLTDGHDVANRLLVCELDVRDPASVDRGVAAAARWGSVDVLVNNAGYAVFGTQEEADLEAVRDLFDVNVLGAARVTQRLLRQLRERRGTIVQLSSIAGRTVFPESGFYAATKYALEAMSEALFQETCTFGIRVRLIEPGSFDTRFLATAAVASRPRSPQSAYAGLHPVWDDRKFGVLEKPQRPALVVDAILSSLESTEAFLRVPVGPDAERVLGLRDALTADAWVRFAAERNGAGPTTHVANEVLSPQEVLQTADVAALAATLAALRFGHLTHWAQTEEGRSALAHLRCAIAEPL
jgi:NADP-dependent 3-hydroxy acid dehydrogenase YdfG